MTTTILIIVGVIVAANVAYLVLGRKKKGDDKPVVLNQGNDTQQEPQKPDKEAEKPTETEQQKNEREEFITHIYHNALRSFRVIVDIPDNCELAHYLECLTYECYYQYYEQHSNVGLPAFYLKENFPAPYDY